MSHTPLMTLTILTTSDVHGYLYPTDYRSSEVLPIGLARLAGLIEQEREQADEVLLIDNGDLLQGTPMAYAAAMQEPIRAQHPVIAAMNHLGYDAAVIGNHEFNYGKELLDEAMRQSAFRWLSANITTRDSGEPAYGSPYFVKKLRGGTGPKVAVLGATTHYIPNWERPEHIEGLEFKDAYESVKAWVQEIRAAEQPDVLVVCYHGGFERDPEQGAPEEEETGENQGYRVISGIEGIDVLVTGHQHRRLAGVYGDVAYVQPGCFGQALGSIRLELVQNADGWRIARKDAAVLVPDRDAEPDRELLALAEQAELATQAWLDQPLGTADEGLAVEDSLTARMGDHPFVEFMNRVQIEASGVQISCTAIFSDASRGFSGAITMRDIISNYPFPNTLKVLRVSGRDIKEALEKSAAYWTIGEDGSLQVHPSFTEPKPQPYNYDMWEGIRYRFNIARPIGERVEDLQADDQPLNLADTYEVVMNNYRAAGGGEYAMFRGKPVVRELQMDMVELLADYVLKHRHIPASCDRNWSVYISDTNS